MNFGTERLKFDYGEGRVGMAATTRVGLQEHFKIKKLGSFKSSLSEFFHLLNQRGM
jgi:hypothetical protein